MPGLCQNQQNIKWIFWLSLTSSEMTLATPAELQKQIQTYQQSDDETSWLVYIYCAQISVMMASLKICQGLKAPRKLGAAEKYQCVVSFIQLLAFGLA